MIQKDTTFAFSSCNRKSNIGPSQTEVDNAYKGTKVSVTIIGSGTQKWVVPQTGFYLINAAGAAGISSCSDNIGGNGAQLVSLFELKKNDVLYILVGQQGITPSSNWGGAGGGASFVAKRIKKSDYYLKDDSSYVIPLLVAAGGGGSGDCNDKGSPKSAGSGSCETKEEGAGTTGESDSSAGAGFVTNAKKETKSFLNGGLGGSTYDGNSYGYGGFGGGGCPNNAGGGGGGFKGGNSGAFAAAGTGGYSFGSDKPVYYLSGSNAGNGFVTIVFKGSLNNCSPKRKEHRITCNLHII